MTTAASQIQTKMIGSSSPSRKAPVSHGFSNDGSWRKIVASSKPRAEQASALDALATLAATKISSPEINDFRAMPPPPPRRMRSASNPEGMEKWDSYQKSSRRHFVLPYSILEEELASANIACQEHEEQKAQHQVPKRGLTIFRVNEEKQSLEQNTSELDELGTSPTTVVTQMLPKETLSKAVEVSDDSHQEEPEEEDERDLEPEELLTRARSRLLEDLATETTGVQKGVLPLPHALDKYKSLYNKNGRIGIYTPVERAAIIAKFNSKRGRRVWNKKIRYNCRKNLADRRMRVKGRFVKRAVEQEATTVTKPASNTTTTSTTEGNDNSSSNSSTRTNSPIPANQNPTVQDTKSTVTKDDSDVDMPDVNDPEAGFAPTADQPFRRVRRHTII